MLTKNVKNRTYSYHIKGTPICLLCSGKSFFPKKHNIERHFNTVYCGIDDNFPISSVLRMKVQCDLKTSISTQLKCLFLVQEVNTAATITSFNVFHHLAKRMKPFEDSEVIKEAMTEDADVLLDSFLNKIIKSAIANLQLSRNSVTRRVECLSRNTKVHAMDIDNSEWLSL